MGRRILNLAALAIVCAGTSHVLAKPAAATLQEYCCTSGNGYTCCGTLYCSSNADSCEARDRLTDQ